VRRALAYVAHFFARAPFNLLVRAPADLIAGLVF